MTAQVRALIAEFLGAFCLVFIGGLAILSNGGLIVVAFGFGLALLAGLFAFGEVSGGHFNPAVSLGALLDKRIDAPTFVQYVVAQVAGAVGAALVVLWTFAEQGNVEAIGTVPAAELGRGGAFLLELVFTAIFVAVILYVTKSAANAVNSFAAIALTLVAVHLAIAVFTGASVNPARTLGPAIVGNSYTDIWIYMTAPFIGGALGWILYQVVTGSMGRTGTDDRSVSTASTI